MFLKNDSNFQCGLRTKKEVLTIKPGQIVHVLDSEVLTINSKLVKVSEKEYNEYLEKVTFEPNETQQPLQPQAPANPAGEGDGKEDGKEEKEDGKEEKEDGKDEAKDEGKDEQVNDPESLEALEAKLEELKTKWQEATRPNRKEAIHKQIKEVQDKINKLK